MRAGTKAVGVALAMLGASGCAVTHTPTISASPPIDDKVITSAIQARYAQSTEVAAASITVETLYGVVLLSGSANNPQEKSKAQVIAGQVNGVKAVRNEIQIQP